MLLVVVLVDVIKLYPLIIVSIIYFQLFRELYSYIVYIYYLILYI